MRLFKCAVISDKNIKLILKKREFAVNTDASGAPKLEGF
jgi:hypothetical protein